MADKSRTPEKMDLRSMDISNENRAKLKQLFPSVFAETRNEKGELVESVDFEKLKAELGTFSDLFENRRERYGMDWPGKKDGIKLIQQPSIGTLKPCREESVNFDGTENLFIEGDNLEVLKLLQKSYYGKVKVICIDPPYNTGKEFIYPDNYSESLDTYLAYAGLVDAEGRKFSTNTANEGRFHTKWLNMMYPRLYLARNLLREDGVIFICIDDNEVNNLRKMCDEIFGEENQIGLIANVNNPKGRSDDKFIATAHEYLMVYAKNKVETIWLGFEPEHKVVARYNKLDGIRKYREIDLRKTGDADLKEDRPEMFYYFYFDDKNMVISISKEQITNSKFIEIIPIREDGRLGRWRWGYLTSKENLNKLICRYMPNRKIWGIFEKDFLDDRDLLKPVSAWHFKDVNSERGSEQFIELGFDKEIFPKPKPIGTIKRCLQLSTSNNDIFLDFFSGSCTAAHAVLDLNKQDNGNRKFIMVQLPEPCDENSEAFKAGYKTIADIGKERIRRVISKLEAEQASKAKEDADTLPGMAKEQAKLDLGFKVFKLDKSNFKLWDGSDTNVSEEKLARQLELHIDHINPKASPEDVLYELLLKAGFKPTEKVVKKKLAGKAVFSIADGGLLICLEDNITRELIDAVAEAEPFRFICMDRAFNGNDQLKANAVQTFEARNQGRDKAQQIVFRTV